MKHMTITTEPNVMGWILPVYQRSTEHNRHDSMIAPAGAVDLWSLATSLLGSRYVLNISLSFMSFLVYAYVGWIP